MILLIAIISVTLALIFYSISIFREWKVKNITRNILILFWIGFFFDFLGSVLMSRISEGFEMNTHSIIGLIALVLMGIKAVWSSINYKEGLGKRVPIIYTFISSILWLSVFVFGFFRG